MVRVCANGCIIGSAIVEGLYSPQSNDEAGYGIIYSFVLRWPLQGDFVEESWGYMHLGSYEEKDLEDWFLCIRTTIRDEQKRKLMPLVGNSDDSNRAKSLNLALDHEPIFPYCEFVRLYNMPISRWILKSTENGTTYVNYGGHIRYSVYIEESVQKVLHAFTSEEANTWTTPYVKNAKTNQNTLYLDDHLFTCNSWDNVIFAHSESDNQWIGWTVNSHNTGSLVTCIASPESKFSTQYTRHIREFIIQ